MSLCKYTCLSVWKSSAPSYLLVRFRLLLDQLETPRRLDRTGQGRKRFEVAGLGQVFADQPRHENLRPLLPLVHDLLRRHHLITLEPVQQRDAHDRRLDAGVVRERREDGALHLDVHDAKVVQLLEVLHLFRLAKLAERTVQATLA